MNIGAGKKRIDGWVSVDLAGEPDIVADVRTLPLPDGCADEAMAIHVIEHLYRWDAPAALKEWHRVIKPGGRLILELPDLLKCCRNVLSGKGDRMGIWGLYGDPRYENPLMTHRWGWTASELVRELKSAGFDSVTEKKPEFHKMKGRRDMRLEAIK